MISVTDHADWAECEVLRVGVFPHAPAGRSFDLGDCIAVLVPNNTLRLTVDARARGHRYQALVDGNAVSVLPPCSRLDIEEVAPGSMLVMALERNYLEERLGDGNRHMSGVPHAIDPYLQRLGNTLRSAFRVRRPPSADYLEILARDLREHLVNWYSRQRRQQTTSALSSDRQERAIAFMRERFADKELGVADIAASVGLSAFHFTRMFTVATGKAPHAYLTQIRMEEAKRLLGDTCLPIATIAQRSGYATHAHFTGVFGRHVGVTPARFREEVRAARAAERARSAGKR
jgi:AraC-like DNA-binding protein